MPIVVACRCGKKFAAQDHLAGQQVPCPACGRSLTIAAAQSAATKGIYVTCRCGRAFLAPESLAGGQAKCPGCHGIINVPHQTFAADPLGLGELPPETFLSQDLVNQLFDDCLKIDRPSLDREWRAYMSTLKTDVEVLLEGN